MGMSVKQGSRTFPSCKTETLCPLNSDPSSFPPPQPHIATFLLSDSINLTALANSCVTGIKRTVFVFCDCFFYLAQCPHGSSTLLHVTR